MKRSNNKLGYTIAIVLLCVLLSVSGYISLVVVGVIADEKVNGGKNQTQATYDDTDYYEEEEYYIDDEGNYVDEEGNIIEDIVVEGVGGNGQADVSNPQENNSTDKGDAANGNGNTATQNGGATGGNKGNKVNKYLNTNKTAADVVSIYAKVMNKAKKEKPGFTKIEYQELPSDAENRVISEGEENVTAEWIDKLFGFVENLGIFIPKEKALEEPYIHAKGDQDMSFFPVFSREKGSYLTDPKAIKSFSYRILSNGNVKMRFILVNENNPEPIGENTNVAPSYTGAIFSPMSKERIDGTLNHPIVSVFATNIKYSLKYHDCSVEVEFDPDTLVLVKVTQIANVSIKGSGKVRGVGVIGVEKQELIGTVIIKDFKW